MNELVDDASRAQHESSSSELASPQPLEHPPSKIRDPSQIPGISLKSDCNGEKYYEVSWATPHDPFNPQQWSHARRVASTMCVCLIALVTTMASAIDSAVLSEASQHFGVSQVAESLATGLYLIGFGVGALIASPMSEIVGRFPVYIGALVIFGSWILGAALAPNFGSQLVFRFLAGLCGSAPLTVAGGSISDVWSTLEKTFGFPIFAIPGFGGPILGEYRIVYRTASTPHRRKLRVSSQTDHRTDQDPLWEHTSDTVPASAGDGPNGSCSSLMAW